MVFYFKINFETFCANCQVEMLSLYLYIRKPHLATLPELNATRLLLLSLWTACYTTTRPIMCETNSNSKHFKQDTCTKNNASTLFSLKAIVAHRDIWSLQQKLCQCHFYKFIKFNKVHQKLHLNFKLHHTALQALIAWTDLMLLIFA